MEPERSTELPSPLNRVTSSLLPLGNPSPPAAPTFDPPVQGPPALPRGGPWVQRRRRGPRLGAPQWGHSWLLWEVRVEVREEVREGVREGVAPCLSKGGVSSSRGV